MMLIIYQNEIRKLRSKTNFDQHQSILNPIFNGKNIDMVIKNTSIKYKTTDKMHKKRGSLIEVAIEPRYKVKSRYVNLISDMNVIPIIQSSCKSLTYLKLNSCVLLTKKTFEVLETLDCIKKLSITKNE